MNDDEWARAKLEEIVAPMLGDEMYIALFQVQEQERIWKEYQETKKEQK